MTVSSKEMYMCAFIIIPSWQKEEFNQFWEKVAYSPYFYDGLTDVPNWLNFITFIKVRQSYL